LKRNTRTPVFKKSQQDHRPPETPLLMRVTGNEDLGPQRDFEGTKIGGAVGKGGRGERNVSRRRTWECWRGSYEWVPFRGGM